MGVTRIVAIKSPPALDELRRAFSRNGALALLSRAGEAIVRRMCSWGGKRGSPDKAVTYKPGWGVGSSKNLIKAEAVISKYTLLENLSFSCKAWSWDEIRAVRSQPPHSYAGGVKRGSGARLSDQQPE